MRRAPLTGSYPSTSARLALPLAAAVLLAGCGGGVQTVMEPASREAAQIWRMGQVLFSGGAIIFIVVMAFAVVAAFGGGRLRERLGTTSAIIAGGIVFPAVVLTSLLVYGLMVMAPSAPAAAPLNIEVRGERWWWRVRYEGPGNEVYDTANEIRVPVGRPVRFTVITTNVIHSFWVPQLAGKIDLIPGRTNTLTLVPARAGVYRGQCAEYCGGAHALMAFRVVALPAEEFDAWLAAARRPAVEPTEPLAASGKMFFLRRGCAGCHAILGTTATGTHGPDLSNVGSRAMIASEVLETSVPSLVRWIMHNDEVKPSNLMPVYDGLPREEVEAIAHYLMGLKVRPDAVR